MDKKTSGVATQTSQTDYFTEIEQTIKTALDTQQRISKLFEIPYVRDLFYNKVSDTENSMNGILDNLGNIMGYAFIERKREEAQL